MDKAKHPYKEKEVSNPLVKEPNLSFEGYSYADYLSWEMDEMVELIKGKIFKKAAAPRRIHQQVAGNLFFKLRSFLQEKKCKVYFAPFDVRLPKKSMSDDEIHTVVQPDICVICDPSKLDDKGCIGAPDLVVEILSPGNKQHELKRKYEVYEEAGVKEYWLLDPESQTLLVYTLENKSYKASRLMTSGDIVYSQALEGFSLNLEEFFNALD
ncbi:MAG: Uma2 family endonuclease [Mongoliitalea sp.]